MKQNCKINYVVILVMAVILASIIVITTFAQSAFNVAYAAESGESLEEKAERYTDSDTLANGIGKIQYYPESYHLSKTLIESSPKYAYAQYSIEVTESDPIVNIVPMEYFINRGTYLYIGKEYGFFVNTIGQDFSQFDTGGYESKNNIVDVMVFDIEDEYDFDQTTDRILMTMRNLFQYRFAYISADEHYSYVIKSGTCRKEFLGFYSYDNDYVIPLATSINVGLHFDMLNQYYIKDVCTAATLYNEQEYNAGDVDYDAMKDDGTFFTSYTLSYDGVKREKGEITTRDKMLAAKSFVDLTIGILDAANLIDHRVATALSLVSNMISCADSIKTLSDKSHYTFAPDIYDGYLNSTLKRTTKQEQLENYRDEDGNPRLAKVAACCIQGNDEEGNIWYGTGNYATASFRVSNTANLNDPWLTRCYRDIGFTVVDSDGNNLCTSIGSKSYTLYEPNYKIVAMEQPHQLYFLYEGDNYFEYIPEFTSMYTLNFADDYDYEIYYGLGDRMPSNFLSKENGKYSLMLKAGNYYYFRIHAGDGHTNKVTIEPAKYGDKMTVAPYSNVLVTVGQGDNSMHTLQDSGLTIRGVYTYENGELIPAASLLNYKPANEMDVYLKRGSKYYVILDNATSANVNCNLKFSTLSKTLAVGSNAQSLIETDNYRYYKFVPPANAEYSIYFEGLPQDGENIIYFYMISATGVGTTPTEQFGDGYLSLKSLEEGTTYYIGVKALSDVTLTPYVEQSQAMGKWRIKDNGTWKDVTDNTYNVIRGKQYEIELYIHNTKIARTQMANSLIDNPTTYIDGVLDISPNCIYYTSIEIEGVASNETTYNFNLNLIVVLNLDTDLTWDIDYVNKMQVNFTRAVDILNWKFDLLMEDNQHNSITESYTTTDISIDFMSVLMDYNATSAVVKVKQAYVKGGTQNNSYYWCDINKDIELDCYYSKYETVKFLFTTHYYRYISNELQLNNMRYYQSGEIRLNNDITLSHYANWTPIPELNNNFSGQSHIISKMNININQPGNYGLFAVNNARLTDLYIVNSSIKGNESSSATWTYAGFFAGVNNSNIVTCAVYDCEIEYYQDASCIGGIAGQTTAGSQIAFAFTGMESHSYEPVTIKAGGDIGGIVGQAYGTVASCAVWYTTITSRIMGGGRSIGGIAGYCVNTTIQADKVHNSTVCNGGNNSSTGTPKMGLMVGHMEKSSFMGECDVTNCTADCSLIKSENNDNRKANCFTQDNGWVGLKNE